MAIQTQWRGGTTKEHARFIGANREMTIDTDKKTAVIHDASTQGGFPLAREDLSNVQRQTLIAKLAIDVENIENLDPLSLIKKEKAKLKAEFTQKIKELMINGKTWFEQIKSAVIAMIQQENILQNTVPLGIVFPYTSRTAPDGFLLLNGETIGSQDSNATHHDACYQSLYVLLWDNIDEVHLGIEGGKGQTALEDWQSNKTITLPDLRGRSVIGSGLGNGLTDRALGQIGGSEAHQLTLNEMPSHTHSLGGEVFGSGSSTAVTYVTTTHYTSVRTVTESIGSNGAHNNMSPWLALNWIIKC